MRSLIIMAMVASGCDYEPRSANRNPEKVGNDAVNENHIVDVLSERKATEWRLINLKLDNQEVELGPEPVTFAFNENGKANGRSAVNRYVGIMEIDRKGGCNWELTGITGMASTPLQMNVEGKYLRALRKVTKVERGNGVLVLSSESATTACTFEARQASPWK